MGAFLNSISFIFEVKISFVSVIYIRSRIRQLMKFSVVDENVIGTSRKIGPRACSRVLPAPKIDF